MFYSRQSKILINEIHKLVLVIKIKLVLVIS